MKLCITLEFNAESHEHLKSNYLPNLETRYLVPVKPYIILMYDTYEQAFTTWKSSNKPQGLSMCLSTFDAFMLCHPGIREVFYKSLKRG